MTAPDLVEQVFIMDRSGSMASRIGAVLEAFNALIDEQRKQPGRCNVTIALFDAPGHHIEDNGYTLLYDGQTIEHVYSLSRASYFARGGTALRDAIGRTVDHVGARLARTPEHMRPKKVIVSIFSDGEENSSSQYSSERVKAMIEHQKSKYGWDFTFVGTNQDAVLQAGNYGIAAGNALFFSNTAKGFAGGIRGMSNYVSASRAAAPGEAVCYSAADRSGALDGADAGPTPGGLADLLKQQAATGAATDPAPGWATATPGQVSK